MEHAANSDRIELATEIVSAYVSRNSVPAADLPGLLVSVHGALAALGAAPPEPVAEKRPPAVPVKKSVTDEFIISLEDGRKLKTLKRYLAKLGMTPAEYRAKWGLPDSYPMVAPAYGKQRSEMAYKMRLGKKPPAVEPESELEAADTLPKKRGRAKAT